MQLNRFLAMKTSFSRRAINQLIKEGKVKVNRSLANGFTHPLQDKDAVYFKKNLKDNSSKVIFHKNINKTTTLILNKPVGYITSKKDFWNRRTVFDLLPEMNKTKEKNNLHYIGRLDKNTSGLLLFTNNGKVTNALAHPSNRVAKNYSVELSSDLKKKDLKKLIKGLSLEDGFIKPDLLRYKNNSKKNLEISIHSGKKRVIRRMFFQLGYKVIELKRISFAGISLGELGLGQWRFLTEAENNLLINFKIN